MHCYITSPVASKRPARPFIGGIPALNSVVAAEQQPRTMAPNRTPREVMRVEIFWVIMSADNTRACRGV
jgi:hypothetical protein